MAIGAIHLAWLRRLAALGAFRGLHSVLDVGPQDIQIDRSVLAAGLRDVVPADRLNRLLSAIYVNGTAARDAQPSFYGLFGLGPYASIDVDDDRATHRLDLNFKMEEMADYDVVTNFGTTEHVFNIGEAFRSIHKLTRPGGVSLHCVPCFGFINHGFYTVNPNLFVEMAYANQYNIVDFSYFDNAFVRNTLLNRTGVDQFDVAALPIRLEDMENTQAFGTKVVDLFCRNLTSAETRDLIAELDPAIKSLSRREYPNRNYHICFVFDLIFFAMRRPSRRMDFVMPLQNPAGVQLSRRLSQIDVADKQGSEPLPDRNWLKRWRKQIPFFS
jgi:hypothetical protein